MKYHIHLNHPELSGSFMYADMIGRTLILTFQDINIHRIMNTITCNGRRPPSHIMIALSYYNIWRLEIQCKPGVTLYQFEIHDD